MSKSKIQLEYVFNILPSLLFAEISTPSGLSDWFADDVVVDQDQYTFKWGNSEEKATLIASRPNGYMRFRREDEEDHTYFEFRIVEDELTTDISLIITDFVDNGEEEDQRGLWDVQVNKLKRVVGI